MERDANQHVGIDGDGAARFEVFPRGADDGRVERVCTVVDGHEVVKQVEKGVVDKRTVTQHGAVVGVLWVMGKEGRYVGVVAFDGDVHVKLWVCLVVVRCDHARHIYHHRNHHTSILHTHLLHLLRVHDIRFRRARLLLVLVTVLLLRHSRHFDPFFGVTVQPTTERSLYVEPVVVLVPTHIQIDHVLQLLDRRLHLLVHLLDSHHVVHDGIQHVWRRSHSAGFAVELVAGVAQAPHLHSLALRTRYDSIEIKTAVLLMITQWRQQDLGAARAQIAQHHALRVYDEEEGFRRCAGIQIETVHHHLEGVEQTVDEGVGRRLHLGMSWRQRKRHSWEEALSGPSCSHSPCRRDPHPRSRVSPRFRYDPYSHSSSSERDIDY